MKKKDSLISKVRHTAAVAGIVTVSIQVMRQLQQRGMVAPAASSPLELSKQSWKQALQETKAALGNKNLSIIAAGVAYFATLAFFPALAALISVLALVITPEQVDQMVRGVESYMPAELASLINQQLQNLVAQDTANLIAAIVAIGVALWGASAGIQNLVKATNIAYDEDETRNFIMLKLLSIGLVLAAVLLSAVIVGLIVLRIEWLVALGVPSFLAAAFPVIRWFVIVLLVIAALAIFYRYGPDRKNAQWQWVSWGAVAATVIWLVGTVLFFLYAQYFGSFTKSYGIFAGIIVLMTWLNLSSFIVLLGAEVNHRLERQTSASTTV